MPWREEDLDQDRNKKLEKMSCRRQEEHWKFRNSSPLKTKTDGQAWLTDDPHKGRNTEGSKSSIILLRVKCKYIF